MDFIDLHRFFISLKKDAEAVLEWGQNWGVKYGGWLDWDDLLSHRRVVLLAEALSGKTEEFLHRVSVLNEAGRPSFFVSIEDLADDRFESALNDAQRVAFNSWKEASTGDAWFFLDSVDEARLNGKKFTAALQSFRDEVSAENLNRTHIIVSCRVSDWHGKADREALQRVLPFVQISEKKAPADPDKILLTPVINETRREPRPSIKVPEASLNELLVVQLAPLTSEQQRRMVENAAIHNAAAFAEAVHRSGLETLCERPGDLIGLIEFWLERGQFGSLLEMIEEGVKRKLREENAFRADGSALSPDNARQGVERLAAALVLGKSFTIKAPGQESDHTLAKGAIDPRNVLSDWDQDSTNALLRKGIFAPGTYGRVRFHHRTTQEYLAASWLRRLESNNLPLSELSRLLFAESYGVQTVVPSLRTVAAWLSLWIPMVRDQVVAREPVSLIAHGDPKSLSLKVRERLLEVYAELDAKGDLNAESIDYRAVWMFSSPDLSGAVRKAWCTNDRGGFRMHLLRFIEEGPIPKCADLARTIALDIDAEQWLRISATRALIACKDEKSLRAIAKLVRTYPDRLNARVAPHFAKLLYPRYLSTTDLIDLIDRSEPGRPYKAEGFADSLASLHASAPDRKTQKLLATGVANLALKFPHIEEDVELSSRHAELGKGLPELTKCELDQRTIGDVDEDLIRLLVAVERVQGLQLGDDDFEVLAKRVREDKQLQRRLIWTDAGMDRKGRPTESVPKRIWQVGPHTGHKLWSIDQSDLEWLVNDVKTMPHEYQRRIAFSAILWILGVDPKSPSFKLVEDLAASEKVLQSDLVEFLTPPPENMYAKQDEVRRKKSNEKTQKIKNSWIEFRNRLSENPSVLDAPEAVKSWEGGLSRLHYLTHWINLKAGHDSVKGPRKWELLEQGFGYEVLKHYERAMTLAWRNIPPERPKKQKDNSFSTKFVSLLAIQGLEIESQKSDWDHALSNSEVRLAIQHACFAGTLQSEWVDRLIETRSHEALPEVVAAVATEYRIGECHSDVLRVSAYGETAALAGIAEEVFRLMRRKEPANSQTFEMAIRILRRGVNSLPSQQLRRLAITRFDLHHSASNDKWALQYLGVLSSVDPERFAITTLETLVKGASESETEHSKRIQHWLGELFAGYGEHGLATIVLPRIPVPYIVEMLRLAFLHIPERDWDDADRGGLHKAQSARGMLFKALADRPGAEAFHALVKLSTDPLFASNSLRLRELAHARAEEDGELPAWNEAEVAEFEHRHVAPVKTGTQLHALVHSILTDIQTSFEFADASSRSVLALAQNEADVQQWLAERLNERAKGRYVAFREVEVADRNEPDITVSSTSCSAQIAIEIKNANMGWTVQQLENALHVQLAQDYLLADERRNGILVVSLHMPRTWRKAGRTWQYDQLISHLQDLAGNIQKNKAGPVQVSAFGLNATSA